MPRRTTVTLRRVLYGRLLWPVRSGHISAGWGVFAVWCKWIFYRLHFTWYPIIIMTIIIANKLAFLHSAERTQSRRALRYIWKLRKHRYVVHISARVAPCASWPLYSYPVRCAPRVCFYFDKAEYVIMVELVMVMFLPPIGMAIIHSLERTQSDAPFALWKHMGALRQWTIPIARRGARSMCFYFDNTEYVIMVGLFVVMVMFLPPNKLGIAIFLISIIQLLRSVAQQVQTKH